ncbi:MAG: RNA polymerase sigma-54 factor, partial [Nitrospirota bacterium]
MKLRLVPQLSQRLIMTPQLQQAIKLLQLSRLELQQSLTQHLLENPLLDEMQSDTEEGESLVNEEKVENPTALEGQDRSEATVGTREEQGSAEDFSVSGWEEYLGRDQRSGASEYSSAQDEFPSYEQTVAKATSLEEHLLWQLSLSGLSDREKELGRLIIGNLDDDGYLRIPLAEVVAGTDLAESEVESVLKD